MYFMGSLIVCFLHRCFKMTRLLCIKLLPVYYAQFCGKFPFTPFNICSSALWQKLELTSSFIIHVFHCQAQ